MMLHITHCVNETLSSTRFITTFHQGRCTQTAELDDTVQFYNYRKEHQSI